MIKAAICDDDAAARAYLAALVRAQNIPCRISEYASAGACLADCGAFDLLLLDIELDGSGADGLALARTLRERAGAARPVIIFVTGHEQYVFDAFDVDAFQYLLKPVDEARFAQVFARAARQLARDGQDGQAPRALTLRAAGANRVVPPDEIRYIESSGHKVVLHLTTGEFSCYAKLRDLELTLGDRFFRIHKGYLVNLACVSGYSRTEVTLAGGERLLLSKYKYQDFVKACLRFLKEGAGL